MNKLFLLLIIFQLKHFFADYPLQGKYMLGKFKEGYEWILPLLCHVAVHGIFTFTICLFSSVGYFKALLLTLFDMTIHFVMDRIKASPNMLGRYKAMSGDEYKTMIQTYYNIDKLTQDKFYSEQQNIDLKKTYDIHYNPRKKSNVLFWWSLGLDQMVHHLTHYCIIYWLVT